MVGVLALALLLTWCSDGAGYLSRGKGGDTVWLPVRVDTIRDTVIAPPVSEKPAGTDTARLPVLRPNRPKPSPLPKPLPGIADSLAADSLIGDSSMLGPVSPPDSVEVLIPLTEREYRSPDYRIVVSGYQPQLKEVELYRRTEVGIVNPPRPKRKRWGFGPCL